ncbi:MAG: glycosyltransferase family 2 protein [Dehalococcoidia bacterium]
MNSREAAEGAFGDLSVAVLIPCYNEEATIAKVIADFRAALPGASVYVCDNASSDRTSEIAGAAMANVLYEGLPGKGNAVWRLFADVEADIYVLVDGDDTYEAGDAPKLIRRLLDEGLDMVTGARVSTEAESYRFGHRVGNAALAGIVKRIFGSRAGDMLSGYRVFSRRFVKSFASLSRGFEIETELTVHALELRVPSAEVATRYYPRPEGSTSKLRTYRDGARILKTIVVLLKDERPLQFFAAMGAVLAIASVALGIPLFIEYAETGLVPRLPTGVVASSLMLLAFLSMACGLTLDTVTRGRREMKRMRYLEIPALPRVPVPHVAIEAKTRAA